MISFYVENMSFKYLLTIIDCFSIFSWAINIKNKIGVEVSKAISTILSDERTFKNLHTDDARLGFSKHVPIHGLCGAAIVLLLRNMSIS